MLSMKLSRIFYLIAIGLITLLFSNCKTTPDVSATTSSPLIDMMGKNIPAPSAPSKPKELTIHGDTRQDPYYWLNDRENPEVITYLNEENAYLDTILSHSKPYQEKLYNELIGRIKQT